MFEAVASVLSFPNDPNLVFSDDELAYWHLIWTLNDKDLKSRPCHDGISKKPLSKSPARL
jgi:hypothetical protein